MIKNLYVPEFSISLSLSSYEPKCPCQNTEATAMLLSRWCSQWLSSVSSSNVKCTHHVTLAANEQTIRHSRSPLPVMSCQMCSESSFSMGRCAGKQPQLEGRGHMTHTKVKQYWLTRLRSYSVLSRDQAIKYPKQVISRSKFGPIKFQNRYVQRS